MTQSSQIGAVLSARELAEGLIAALAASDNTEFTVSQSQLHSAFRKVLSEASQHQDLKVDLSDVDYDPLYGLSSWFDRFLARAQRDLLISYPNPSYERVVIKLGPNEGNAILSEYENPEALKQLSNLFIRELQLS